MGCFSGKKSSPQMNIPQPPKLPTAEELFAAAVAQAKQQTPLAYGAREGALADLARGNEYYEEYQPLSIEQALGNQYFSNIIPELERNTKHRLSLSGMADSPALADIMAKAEGNVGFDVGSFLLNSGNARAESSLLRRLGIDPNSITNPFVETGMNQGNAQANLQSQYDIARAMDDYQNAMQAYNKKSGMISTMGSLGGAGLGFLVGGPGGAMIGSSLGGSAASLFGGSGQSPVGLGDAMSIYQMFNNGQPKSGYGKNTPYGTYDMGNYSMLPQKTAMPVYGGY